MVAERATARMMDLQDLLQGIDDGTIALPDFQRDFDWSDNEVKALIVTVLNGWPAGSLLFMRAYQRFHIRPFEAGPTPSPEPSLLVLDGQQRLTALYHAFYGRGPYVYVL